MKIAVLDFNCNSVDIITVDETLIDERYNGEVEDFLTGHCQYNPNMIQWMAGNLQMNLALTEKSFGSDCEFEWEPEEKHIRLFNLRTPKDKYVVDEILITNPEIFGTDEEQRLLMRFYDGYAIEERLDSASPLVLLYPTMEEVHHWECLLSGILEYVQGTSEDDITPHDSALKWGVLFRMTDINNINRN